MGVSQPRILASFNAKNLQVSVALPATEKPVTGKVSVELLECCAETHFEALSIVRAQRFVDQEPAEGSTIGQCIGHGAAPANWRLETRPQRLGASAIGRQDRSKRL